MDISRILSDVRLVPFAVMLAHVATALGCKTEHPGDTSGFLVDAGTRPDSARTLDGAPRTDAIRKDGGGDARRNDGGRSDGPAGDARRRDGGTPDAAPLDDDHDGLADAEELRLARDYLPYLSIDPTDGCPTMGALFRARKHPADPTLVQITYVLLYDKDCGLGGHNGDDEAFGVTIDPAIAPPKGLVAQKAISHQGTLCERQSECGVCPGMTPCDLLPKGGVPTPVMYASKDKHGSYARLDACGLFSTCLDSCTRSPAPTAPVVLNAGESNAHLVMNLTTQGFITMANGWTSMELFNYDPWGGMSFGGAGNVADDLTDEMFTPQACHGAP